MKRVLNQLFILFKRDKTKKFSIVGMMLYYFIITLFTIVFLPFALIIDICFETYLLLCNHNNRIYIAKYHIKLGNYKRANKILSNMLLQDDHNNWPHLYIGIVHFKENNKIEADAAFNNFIDKEYPDHDKKEDLLQWIYSDVIQMME